MQLPTADAVGEKEYFASEGQSSTFVLVMRIIIGVLMGLGAFFGGMNLMYMTIAARSREIGTLWAIGFSRSHILACFIKNLIEKDTLHIDFLDPDTFRTYTAFPETLLKTVSALNPARIIIDEVQKVPHILDVVHKIIEEKKIKFILTGSNARKLKKTGSDLLGGRACYCRMHPFTASELGNSFSIDRALQTGLIPVIESSIDATKSLSAYVDIYLREEVMAEGLVRNLGSFSRFHWWSLQCNTGYWK